MTIAALHGFLGSSSDWKQFEIPSLNPYELFRKPILPFNQWAESFNRQVTSHILIGYSLGGRLALHALIQDPTKWKAAIIISAHPGLKTDSERKARLNHDQAWATRFLNEPWNSLLKDWNQQPLFSQIIPRNEKDFYRKTLASALTIWSLGNQEDLTSKIVKLPIPILWITGSEDKKFTNIAQKLTFTHPLSQNWSVMGAYHRVPWEKPNAVSTKIKEFIILTQTE